MKKAVKKSQFHSMSVVLILTMCCSLCCACGNAGIPTKVTVEESKPDSGYEVIYAGSYDSEDPEAVVVSFDRENKEIKLYNRLVDRYYTLNYDGTTKFYDKYKSSIVDEQIQPGDVVDVTFVKSKKMLNSVQKAETVWTRENISDYVINALTGNIRLSDGDYRFKDDVLVFSEGKKAEIIDINDVDSISLQGTNHEIYSIVINNGHGYLRLKGQEYFVGGWIEIGNDIIKTVTEDMLLTVPIGTYEVKLSNDGLEGVRTVTIEKGQETELDISDMYTPEEKLLGDIIFVTTPDDAEVYMDGEKVDKSKPFKVEYGIHQLIVKEDGYDTVTQYVKVGQEHATLEVTLEKTKDKSDGAKAKPTASAEATTSGTVTTSGAATTSGVVTPDTSKYKVKVESPEGAEVYVDGNCIGKVPAEFSKVPGSHVITIRKEGYETRSYTITLDEKLENETFSFSLGEKSAVEP